MADYSKMTDEDFDQTLEDIVSGLSAAEILSYGAVNNFFREELNDEVLANWEEMYPKKAGKVLDSNGSWFYPENLIDVLGKVASAAGRELKHPSEWPDELDSYDYAELEAEAECLEPNERKIFARSSRGSILAVTEARSVGILYTFCGEIFLLKTLEGFLR